MAFAHNPQEKHKDKYNKSDENQPKYDDPEESDLMSAELSKTPSSNVGLLLMTQSLTVS